jgi:peptide/nickel transport system substrate-binding protein
MLDVYLSPDHPLANPDVAHYEFDPQAASAVLESLGWTDHDGDTSTARLANGVLGVPDGIPFQFSLLAADDLFSQDSTEIIRDSLANCGVQVDVSLVPAQELLKAGPEGQVFGRQFQTALYTWATSLEPPCFLYSTSEIPGSYPQYPKGWGGANASGFSSQEYGRACAQARASLPGELQYTQAHAQAQSIFSIEIPSLPMYLDRQVLVTRPDLCGLAPQPSGRSTLWNLEILDYGEGCNAEGSILLNSQAYF